MLDRRLSASTMGALHREKCHFVRFGSEERFLGRNFHVSDRDCFCDSTRQVRMQMLSRLRIKSLARIKSQVRMKMRMKADFHPLGASWEHC